MSSRPSSPAVKTPLEDDDLLSEILLRLPPQPSSLPRVSLVCKRWHGLASDPGFFRRFRRHHRRNPPPLLGVFIAGDDLRFVSTLEAPDRLPPGRFSLRRRDGDRFMPLGCRHGLVLIFNRTPNQMLVWDPVTGDQHRLAIPPGIAMYAQKTKIRGAVLRGPNADAHFQVVLTVADNDGKQHRRALACVYSSETGSWGDRISTPLPSEVDFPIFFGNLPTCFFNGNPAVLAGNSLHWVLVGDFDGILEFDLEKQSLAVIRVPVHKLESDQIWVMRAEGGGLDLLFLSYSHCSIQLWKRKTDPDGVASWALGKTIQLDNLQSLKSRQRIVTILGVAEENNVVHLWTSGTLFAIHLEPLQIKKTMSNQLPPSLSSIRKCLHSRNRDWC